MVLRNCIIECPRTRKGSKWPRQDGLYVTGTELVGPSYRVLAGFLIQGFYSIGYMALSGVAYLIYDWRYIEVAITVPVVLFAAYLW